jgi:hypothetical protein
MATQFQHRFLTSKTKVSQDKTTLSLLLKVEEEERKKEKWKPKSQLVS